MKRIFRFIRVILAPALLAVFTLLVATKVAAQCTPPASGLVGWWPGDGTALDLVSNNNGVLFNVAYSNGIVNQAFSFDPENYSYGTFTGVKISDRPEYALTNSLTIEGWIRPRGDSYVIFFRGDGRPGLDPYALSMNGNHEFWFSIGDANGNGTNVLTILPYNQWVHVAATLSGTNGQMKIYTNGVLAAQKFTSIRPFGALDVNQSPGVGIGNVNDGLNTFPFIGDVDEIALYNRALSQAEIQAIVAAGSAGKCTSVVSVTNAAAVPVIAGFTPSSGTNGSLVTILGTNFSATASSNTVYFGAVKATVLGSSTNVLTAMVPVGATFAPITVTVGGLTAAARTAFLSKFAGNGSGISASSFSARQNLSTLNGPTSTVIADLDGDGKPDLIVADNYNNSVSIFRNLGTTGALTAAVFAPRVDLPTTPGAYSPSFLAVADVDGDGRLDIIAAEYGDNLVSVYRNTSTPGSISSNSFAARADFVTGTSPYAVVVRDLDGDGRPEIVTANNGAGTVSILRNTGAVGSNSFAAKVDFAVASGCVFVDVGDLNGDGKPDVVAAGDGWVSVLQNAVSSPGSIGTNAFAPRVDYAIPSGGVCVKITDVDGDGQPDLATTAYLPQIFSVLRNKGAGGNFTTNSFAPRIDYPLNGRGHTLAVGDLDGDGKPDLAVDSELADRLSVFRNASTPGSFTNSSLVGPVEFSTGWNAWGVSIGDLDGDGRPEMVLANTYDGNISIYQNQVPFATNAPPPPVSCTAAPAGLVGWWSGENNSADNTGTNNGTLSASGASYAAGKVGIGFRFDGTNGFVQIPDSASLKPTSVTLEAWIYLDPSLPTNRGGEQIIFKKNTWSAFFEGYSLLKITEDNGNGTYSERFQFCVSRTGNQVPIDSQTIVQRGVWYHVAATYDGNRSTLFVNGVAEATATPGFALDYDTTPVFIGTSGTWAPYLSMFGGIIDEPTIYSRALTTNEIVAIYNSGAGGKCTPSVTPPTTNLVDGSTPGFYNNSLGTILDGTSAQFPIPFGSGGGDPTFYPAPEPNLAPASALLGNWLNNPSALNANWHSVITVPTTWNLNDETAIVYQINGGSNGIASLWGDFDVDNGIYVWVNGVFKFGACAPGLPSPIGQFEYTNVYLGSLPSGTNYVQVMREDNGISTGYQIRLSGSSVATNPFPVTCTEPPSGLVGWWRAESSGNDSVGGNNGVLYPGTAFVAGKVGQAFSFDGISSGVMNTNTPSLTNVQNTFTIEFWAAPQKQIHLLPEDLSDGGTYGQSYVIFPDFGGIYEDRAGVGVSVGTNGICVIEHKDGYMPSLLTYAASLSGWVHVAVVYVNKQPELYLNGVKVRTGVTSPRAVVYPGKNLGNVFDSIGIWQTYGPYQGLLDEMSIYNRALATNEIIAIYNAGSAGKCYSSVAPFITAQPTNRTTTAGGAVAFNVSAQGSAPLSYQWSFNGTNLNGATNATLALSNVQLAQAGNYFVVVSNFAGVAVSSNAVLIVFPPPVCTPSPSGIVAWFAGEGNFTDRISGAGATNSGVGFGAGEVAQGFAFNASNATMFLPASSALDVGAGTGFTLEAWINPADLAQPHPIFEWNDLIYWGVHFFTGSSAGELYANIPDSGGTWHQMSSPGGVLATNVFQHVALTYDKASGVATMYANGQLVAQQNIGSFTPRTAGRDLYIGRRPAPVADAVSFPGLLDEPSVYNRSLTTNEITAIYNASSAGKCSPPPVAPFIISQTPSQVVLLNNTATFTVNAGGTAPLNYFWKKNNVLIPGATNFFYTIPSAQFVDSGKNFSCLVSNAYGTASSTNSSLKVINTIYNDLCSGAVIITNASYTNTESTANASSYGDPAPDCVDGFGNGVWYSFTAPVSGLTDVDTYGSDFDTGLAIYAGSCGSLMQVDCNDDTAGFTSELYIPTTAGVTYYFLVGGYNAHVGNLVFHLHHFTPPAFDVSPTNIAVIVSSNGQFSATVSGTQPIALQWYFNSVPLADGGRISGVTNAALNIANVNTNDGGNYFVVASNFVGVTTSSVAVLTPVILPPSIVVPPVAQTVLAGSNVNFFAVVDGTPPYSYQWYQEGTALADDGHFNGAITPSLTISNLTAADAHYYSLVVANASGSVTSAPVLLTVMVPPVITLNPVGRSVPPGLPTIFTANATGVPAPNYQWQLNGTNVGPVVPGATFKNYTNPAVDLGSLGFYQVIASNAVGVVTSSVAQLTFGPVAAWGRNLNNECLPPPGLTNVFAVAGSQQGIGASFALRTDGTIIAWGAGAGTNIPASANNVVSIATSPTGNTALRSDGRVVSWNGISAPALTNILALAAGNNFGYALRADGTLTNWGGIPTPGFASSLNQLTAIACGYNNAVALRSDGKVFVSGITAVTNVPGSVTNVIAVAAGYTYAMALRADGKVIAWGTGTITNLPTSLTNIVAISAGNYPGENFGLAMRADGKVVAFGDNSSGETNPPAALTNLVSIAVAAAPFHGLALVNDGSPVILYPPIGQTAFTGRDVMLRGVAAGAATLSYQWLLNGTNLTDATNSTLPLLNLQLANAGNYQLFVSNAIGTAISLPAPLNVIVSPLTIASQITATPTNLYQAGKFTVGGITVNGSGPLRYQWFFSRTNNGYAAIVGATNDTLLKDPAFAFDTGNYFVAISNLVGGLTSAPVNVRVLFARGFGYNGVTNPPVNVTNAIALATGGATGNSFCHYLALGADGKVTTWASYLQTSGFTGETNLSSLSNSIVTALAASLQHTLALKSDGTVSAFGIGATNVPNNLSGITAIACGGTHDLALKSDGTVVGWLTPNALNYGQATNTFNGTNLIAIAAGQYHSLGLQADGSVIGWGNVDGSLSIPASTLKASIAIAAGNGFGVALRTNGTVVQWGGGITSYPVPANLSNVVAISASGQHVTALRNDGTVTNWGFESQSFAINFLTNNPVLTNVIGIASGGDHDVALFGTRAPAFTVQPWNRAVTPSPAFVTSAALVGKVAGVQPMSYQWRLNGTNYPGATNDTFVWRDSQHPAGTYQLVASNSYGVAISKPAKVTIVIPLAVALDTTTFNWLTSGSAPWFGQTNITHDGVDAARSGGIGGLQETILQTTLITNFPGSVSFWWKISSEQFFDTLEFRVNGTVQGSISGEVDWTLASFPIATGTNILLWRYSKDSSFDSGLDAAFVDQFAFASAPVINVQPSGVIANLGQNVALHVVAAGTAQLGYQWTQNGTPVGGNSANLILNNVARAQGGTYSVIVTNSGGMAVSSNAAVVVKVPQLLGTPVLLPDGSLQLTSADANGGTLTEADLANFEAQASTNLVNWTTLPGGLNLTNGMLQLNDAARTNFTSRYYRIVEH